MTADQVLAVLDLARFTYEDEVGLHAAVGDALHRGGLAYEREVRLGPSGRIDFLLDAGVGIEVKVAGTVAGVTRQLLRYAQHRSVRELVLLTTVAAHRAVPRSLAGVPVRIHSLIGQGL